MSNCSCPTFTLTTSTGTDYYLPKPLWNNARNNLDLNIRIFDFWDDTFDTTYDGINQEPLIIAGIIPICGQYEGLCFPICFPACFSSPLSNLIANIWTVQNEHLELTISGLGECLNGVYVLQSFNTRTVRGSELAIAYRMTLQRVRDT